MEKSVSINNVCVKHRISVISDTLGNNWEINGYGSSANELLIFFLENKVHRRKPKTKEIYL
jgi:hypothetical protein